MAVSYCIIMVPLLRLLLPSVYCNKSCVLLSNAMIWLSEPLVKST